MSLSIDLQSLTVNILLCTLLNAITLFKIPTNSLILVLLSAAIYAITSSLNSMGSVDISSQTGATNALSVIDGAIAMISEVRSEMGAAENRLTSTVDNLSNVSVNTQRSLTSVEDANFASETSALTKAQILQQAATSMLAQANSAKQTMLVLLQG